MLTSSESAGSLERVAKVFATLSESTRLQILRLLHDGPMSVGELVARMAVKQPCVSKQLGILHHAGLVSRERTGALVRYSISDPMVYELCDLVCRKLHRDGEAQMRAFG